MYMPKIARFTARDPFPPNGVVVGGLSQHANAANNPINLVDPSGLQLCVFCCHCWTLKELKDQKWLKGLPDCPCSVGSPPTNPDDKVWYPPGAAGQDYHLGTSHCMRSKPKKTAVQASSAAMTKKGI